MSLRGKIQKIYPQLTDADFAPLTGTILLENASDERGDYIGVWKHPVYPRPTDQQLADAPDVSYVPVPQQVPMWAVRTVLQNDGLFDKAQTLIEVSPNNTLKNVWEYGNYADRNSRAIASLASTLNLTDAQVDQMFIDANSLEV